MKLIHRPTWPLCLFFSLVFALNSRCQANDAKPVLTLTADTPWVVSAHEPEAVQRALADVKRDWQQVFGHVPVVLNQPPKGWAGPVVYLGLNGAWLKDMVKQPFPGAESFILRVQPDQDGRPALLAAGADVRGAIYAAYALSQEVLGVDPWYYWVDKVPARRDHIEVTATLDEHFGPPTFKYRGWFMNDEDLLSGFAPDPMRENIYSLDMFDHIFETLLRLRGNMVVPATFSFPDERSWELASRRGLILSQHHVQVVGLNTRRWPKDVPYSYTQHPEIMERYWRICINALKGREVIWTIGYRGKNDMPFWTAEPGVTTPEARGALISRVMARQVELVRQVQPNAAFIANLWAEGANLYHAGLIKIPAGVTLVWPDDGEGFIRDQGQVKAGEGIYYHTMMLNGYANRATEMVNPARIDAEVGRFVRAGATQYFLVNVSNIRPVPLSTDCAMRFVWNAAPYLDKSPSQTMDEFLLDWGRRQFGPEAAPQVAGIYRQYFDIPYQRDDQRRGESGILHRLYRYVDRPTTDLMVANKPLSPAVLQVVQQNLEFANTNLAYVSALAKQAQALTPLIPADRSDFYRAHVLIQIQIHLHLLEMLQSRCQSVEAYGRGDRQQTIADLEAGLRISDSLFDWLHQGEYGKWSGWYRGDRFVGVEAARDRLRQVLALMRGQPGPPLRVLGSYGEMYQYQDPLQKNFPLLYPVGQTQ